MTSGSVHRFEHHDAAYHTWRSAGVSGATVIHVDAHHDASWLDDPLHLHIGNYLCQAIKDGMASRIDWVVPDGALRHPRARVEILRQLRTLRSQYGAPRTRMLPSGGFETALGGCTFSVCDLGSLPPRAAGPLLLDIDVDFLMTPSGVFHTGFPATDPWMHPEQLIERLGGIVDEAALTTIAYSVEGGYTPLRWKFLGDELAARLQTSDAAIVRGFELVRAAHALASRALHDDAEAACDAAAVRLPNAAPAEAARTWSRARQGRLDDARRSWALARKLDPSYATAYSGDGPAALETGRIGAAARAFADALQLDAADRFATFGLARVAAHRREWRDAETHARSALALGLDAPDVHRMIARCLEKRGARREAAAALQQALKSALRGQSTSEGVLASRVSSRLPIQDSRHAPTYANLARLEARLGNVGAAVAALRLAIMGGYRRPVIHARLARLYALERRWRAAITEAGRAIALLPAAWARTIARAWTAVVVRFEALA